VLVSMRVDIIKSHFVSRTIAKKGDFVLTLLVEIANPSSFALERLNTNGLTNTTLLT
jgi:hypothetical protein